MPLNKAILEEGFRDLMKSNIRNSFEFASKFASFYSNYALTATPLPVIAGKDGPLRAYLGSVFQAPGTPPTCVTAYITALTVFWLGVPVPGGAVTAFLGGPILQVALNTLNPKISKEAAVRILSTAFDSATRLVQYTIPPGPPAFLV